MLRSDVKRIESQKMSLMPEGLEEGLKPQDLSDLLEFIFTSKPAYYSSALQIALQDEGAAWLGRWR